MVLKFALPIIGWIITLVAMRSCPLTKEEMVNVQKRIAEKKAAAQSEFYKEQLSKPIPQKPKGFAALSAL